MFGQNIYKATCQQHCTIIVLLFLIIAGLNACKPQEMELPFETIELYQYSPKYELKEPGLMIVTSAEEASQLDGWITADALKQLEEIDYETHFAVIVFMGWQPTGHEGIRIERVARTGSTVSISVQIGRRTGDDVVTPPYHLIKVTKTGHWDAVITFNLITNETTLVSKFQRIP